MKSIEEESLRRTFHFLRGVFKFVHAYKWLLDLWRTSSKNYRIYDCTLSGTRAQEFPLGCHHMSYSHITHNSLTLPSMNGLLLPTIVSWVCAKPIVMYPHSQGHIYLIHMEETTFYKIGMSLDPKIRLQTLQSGNPYLLNFFNSHIVQDIRSAGMDLHRQFETKRVLNFNVREWFDLYDGTDEVQAAFATLRKRNTRARCEQSY